MNATTNHYTSIFKAWQSKHLGSKPTAEMLDVAHAFGRPGKQSLALAMAMRPEGVTAGQIQIACGAPQNNHRRGLIEDGTFKRPPSEKNDLGHTVYKIELSAKGNERMKRNLAAVDKAVVDGAKPAKKAKAKTKRAKKVRVVIGDTVGPAVEANTERQPAPEATPEQQ